MPSATRWAAPFAVTRIRMAESPYLGTDLAMVSVAQGHLDEAWKEVRKVAPLLTDWGTDKLRSGLDPHVRTVLIEPHYVCRDFRDIYSHFYSKKFLERTSICNRLHFFSSDIHGIHEAIRRPNQYASSYIGYSVIQPVEDRCLGRSVFDPLMLGNDPDSFFCLRTKTRTRINGADYFVSGYPFISQSGEALVCAHASLWGVCRYLSERYQVYGELHPNDLIRMTSSSAGRRVPYRGMSYRDYSEILTAFGCHPELVFAQPTNSDWRTDAASFYDIYSYIESGFPVLVSFRGHVVAIVGLTLREDLQTDLLEEQTGFYNAFLLVKDFVAVDDNFFPYQRLGFKDDPGNYGTVYTELPRVPCIDSIYSAVVPLAEKVFLPARTARELLYRILNSTAAKNRLETTLSEMGLHGEKLVSRTFLTSGAAFKNRKRQCMLGEIGDKPDDLCAFSLDIRMPHFVWIMEISTVSGFRKRRIIAEVLLDATTNKDEGKNACVYMRIGDTIITGDEEQEFEADKEFVQYTHNLGERDD